MSLLLATNGRAPVSIGDFSIITNETGSTRKATVAFKNDGQILNGSLVNVRNWFAVTAAGVGNNYEVYAEIVGGINLSGDFFDTWLSLGTSRNWIYTNNSVTPDFAIIRVSIKPAGTALVVATGLITLEA